MSYHWNAVDMAGEDYEGDTTDTLAEAVAQATAELFIAPEVRHVDVYRGTARLTGTLLYRVTMNDYFVPGTGDTGPVVYVEDMAPAPAVVTAIDLSDDSPF